jgi:hypothetical protein
MLVIPLGCPRGLPVHVCWQRARRLGPRHHPPEGEPPRIRWTARNPKRLTAPPGPSASVGERELTLVKVEVPRRVVKAVEGGDHALAAKEPGPGARPAEIHLVEHPGGRVQQPANPRLALAGRRENGRARTRSAGVIMCPR